MGLGKRSEIIDGIEQVLCSRCKQYKPVEMYYVRTPLLNLYSYYCKPCQAAIDKKNSELRIEKRGGRKLVRRIPDSDVSYCASCKQWKNKTEFNFWDVEKNILQYYCRDCQHKAGKKHFEAHRERVKETNKASVSRAKVKAQEYLYHILSGAECAHCGITDPAVLTFHHANGDKKYEVSYMVGQGMSLDSIIAEIRKTEILCFNCHMKLEQKKRGWYKSLW